MALRNGNSANVLFADGHSGTLNKENAYENGFAYSYIKGEKTFTPYIQEQNMKSREEVVVDWLLEMGW